MNDPISLPVVVTAALTFLGILTRAAQSIIERTLGRRPTVTDVWTELGEMRRTVKGLETSLQTQQRKYAKALTVIGGLHRAVLSIAARYDIELTETETRAITAAEEILE